MKTYPSPAQAALDNGSAIVAGAVFIDVSPAFRVWGGYGEIVIDGATYKPIGDRGLVSVMSGSLGTSEQGAELSVSGVDPDTLALLDASTLRGATVVIWELIFDGAGANLLAANVALRGRVDRMPLEEEVGGTSTIRVMVEGAVRGLGRSRNRMRSDADQRLILSTDGGMSRVAYAFEKTLYWGGKGGSNAGGFSGFGQSLRNRLGSPRRSLP